MFSLAGTPVGRSVCLSVSVDLSCLCTRHLFLRHLCLFIGPLLHKTSLILSHHQATSSVLFVWPVLPSLSIVPAGLCNLSHSVSAIFIVHSVITGYSICIHLISSLPSHTYLCPLYLSLCQHITTLGLIDYNWPNL